MTDKMKYEKWNLHNYRLSRLLYKGLKKDYIRLYDEKLIERLRSIYYRGIPASVILLSNGLSSDNCHDSAILLAEAFLNDDGDVKILHVTIDSLRLNPELASLNVQEYADHYIVERTNKNGKVYIYDTSKGFVYDKDIYFEMENPEVKGIWSKEDIAKKIEDNDYFHSDSREKYLIFHLVLPPIEMSYGLPEEKYSHFGIELLQREVELFKKEIDYNNICNDEVNHVKGR